MDWFRKKKRGLKEPKKKNLPDGLWVRCEFCEEILYRKELERNLWTCGSCGFHFRIRSSDYIRILIDEGTWKETDKDLSPMDPLKFRDQKKYPDRIKQYQEKTGMKEAIRIGVGDVEGQGISLGVLEFAFAGGSLGAVMGEKIVRAAGVSLRTGRPLVLLSCSGGARMQEGIISLMQLAKTSVAIAKLGEARIPYISLVTHPTTGGASASFSMQGDVIIAEPKALIGFAGPRVIQQTIGQELPEGFQRSEFLLEHGQLDIVVPRKELKSTLARVLRHFPPARSEAETVRSE
ncbi:MAG: acetyl-CoA carboxylase carboxyltransferase subunit beta [Candidatus Eisenbacteria bacterium]|nr:acetyl-CoA carboxylase carboxyltransferase subunit beta [Candidatus Eisenbacteria bacterium]